LQQSRRQLTSSRGLFFFVTLSLPHLVTLSSFVPVIFSPKCQNSSDRYPVIGPIVVLNQPFACVTFPYQCGGREAVAETSSGTSGCPANGLGIYLQSGAPESAPPHTKMSQATAGIKNSRGGGILPLEFGVSNYAGEKGSSQCSCTLLSGSSTPK
jgi:hypothetical protein